MRERALIALLGAFALLANACSGGEGAGRSEKRAEEVRVELREFEVDLDPASVDAGTVRLRITNAGNINHNFRLIRTRLAADALPTEGASVNEKASAIEVIAKIAQIGSGETRTVTAELKTTRYVVICNVPGHYQSGMRATFRVQ